MSASLNPLDLAVSRQNEPPEEVESSAAKTKITTTENWRPLWWLPCELSLQVPVEQFTVGDLLRLHPGSLVSTGRSRSSEVPLYANGQMIGSTEFEAVGEHIGARITELV
jgi:flagellar motor switch/type III secretory pathway protein FliN